MALAELTEIIAPPESPLEVCGPSQFNDVERALNVIFPRDYREFVATYGSGVIRDESIRIEILNPGAAMYLSRVRRLCDYLRDLCDPQCIPFALHPDVPGILPWGFDDIGNDLFFLTSSAPEQWTIVVRTHAYDWRQFDLPMTTYLASSITRKIDSFLWNQDGFFPDPGHIVFQPQLLKAV